MVAVVAWVTWVTWVTLVIWVTLKTLGMVCVQLFPQQFDPGFENWPTPYPPEATPRNQERAAGLHCFQYFYYCHCHRAVKLEVKPSHCCHCCHGQNHHYLPTATHEVKQEVNPLVIDGTAVTEHVVVRWHVVHDLSVVWLRPLLTFERLASVRPFSFHHRCCLTSNCFLLRRPGFVCGNSHLRRRPFQWGVAYCPIYRSAKRMHLDCRVTLCVEWVVHRTALGYPRGKTARSVEWWWTQGQHGEEEWPHEKKWGKERAIPTQTHPWQYCTSTGIPRTHPYIVPKGVVVVVVVVVCRATLLQ